VLGGPDKKVGISRGSVHETSYPQRKRGIVTTRDGKRLYSGEARGLRSRVNRAVIFTREKTRVSEKKRKTVRSTSINGDDKEKERVRNSGGWGQTEERDNSRPTRSVTRRMNHSEERKRFRAGKLDGTQFNICYRQYYREKSQQDFQKAKQRAMLQYQKKRKRVRKEKKKGPDNSVLITGRMCGRLRRQGGAYGPTRGKKSL